MARRHTRFVRPAPRTKMWISTGVGLVTLVNNTNTLIASLSAAALLLRPFTILRLRETGIFSSDQIAQSEAPEGVYAYMIVNDTASALGATAIPSPINNPDSPWFAFQPMTSNFLFGTAVGFTDDGTHFTIDSKAMRKVGPNEDAVVMGHVTGGGADLNSRGRMLVQLH